MANRKLEHVIDIIPVLTGFYHPENTIERIEVTVNRFIIMRERGLHACSSKEPFFEHFLADQGLVFKLIRRIESKTPDGWHT